MQKIILDFSKSVGKIKAMHAVGQPPFYGMYFDFFHYLTEANIPYSRLHDTGGAYGRGVFVDIPNLFRDFDADENDPASYDFAFTDVLLTELVKAGVKPYFRLGVTIENYPHIRAYRIYPPKDAAKWARICEHVIRHYNEGWANGFTFGIEYWEIWNEPDSKTERGSMMWLGTEQEYFDLYEVSAKHLKKCFGDAIKIGGFASCGFYAVTDPEILEAQKNGTEADLPEAKQNLIYFKEYFERFLAFIKEKNAPIDFFSWHSYLGTEDTVAAAKYCEKVLEKHGYAHLETQMNEWNNCVIDCEPYSAAVAEGRRLFGTPEAAARAAAMMCAMQIHSKTDILCYYDATVGAFWCHPYAGMFNPITYEPWPLYYSFAAFGELYRLGNQAECAYEQKDGVYALAAMGEGKKAVLFANSSAEDVQVEANLAPSMTAYAIDEEKKLDLALVNPKKFTLKAGTVVLFKN